MKQLIILTNFFNNSNYPTLIYLSPPPSTWGKSTPSNKIPEATLQLARDHIESYHPCLPHYRRKHAPNARYLDDELTKITMFRDFCAKHPSGKEHPLLSIKVYRRLIKEKGISFAKLGLEECETCVEVMIHNKTCPKKKSPTAECELCNKAAQHKIRFDRAREEYRKDADKPYDKNNVIYSADMQKVIMLPRMPGIKAAVFTRRIIGFHETFAPVGTFEHSKPIAMIWHEGMKIFTL